MATLKAIKTHSVAVGNIQKITNTIKMVATSKFMAADRKLRHTRVFGEGTRRFYVVNKFSYDPKNGRSAVVTSDRGLCGGLHTKICRKVRNDHIENPAEGGIVCLGEKARTLLSLHLKRHFKLVVNGLGLHIPTFKQASAIRQRIFGDWHLAMLTYPFFNNIISYDVKTDPLMTSDLVANSPVLYKYEMDDSQDLDFYLQFSSASLLFFAMNEAFVCELANRITAMSMATKNAGKMRKILMLQYNRKRQEKITVEIIDIISGLKATDKKRKKTRSNLSYLEEEAVKAPVGDPSSELLEHLPLEETLKNLSEAMLQTPSATPETTCSTQTQGETKEHEPETTPKSTQELSSTSTKESTPKSTEELSSTSTKESTPKSTEELSSTSTKEETLIKEEPSPKKPNDDKEPEF